MMGTEKDRIIEAEEGWIAKCNAKGWHCSICGAPPPLSEREIFFETGMCGHCAHVMEKDD